VTPVAPVPAPAPAQKPIPAPEQTAAPEQPQIPEQRETPKPEEKSTEGGSLRETILERYHNGEDLRDIARNLDMGYGEVKLIVELYKGDENS
jgi:hypothetical protein